MIYGRKSTKVLIPIYRHFFSIFIHSIVVGTKVLKRKREKEPYHDAAACNNH